MEDSNNSRLFVVCGKLADVDMLTEAFSKYGHIQKIKLIKEKGVAYIKYDKASSAALAVENLHEAVLNDGRGPKLTVLLAEAPHSSVVRRVAGPRPHLEQPDAIDPDNIPARSRLFLVVPKDASGEAIENEMVSYSNLQYCKTDLIAAKGIVFCKYAKASSALLALEDINERGTLAGYRVKCMLAEPKVKRTRSIDSGWSYQHGKPGPLHQALLPPLDLGRFSASPYCAAPPSPAAGVLQRSTSLYQPASPHLPSTIPGFDACSQPTTSYPSGLGALDPGAGHFPANSSSFTSLANLQSIAALQGAANLSGRASLPAGIGSGLGVLGSMGSPPPEQAPRRASAEYFAGPPADSNAWLLGVSGALGSLGRPALSPTQLDLPSPQRPPGRRRHPEPTANVSLKRLYIVVDRSVTEDTLANMFCCFPGMEYCDLKRDHATGLSRGFGYVNYSTIEAAAAAIRSFDRIELPPGSGKIIKVMYAEPMRGRPPSRSASFPHPLDAPSTLTGSMNLFDDALMQCPGFEDSLSQVPSTIPSDESISEAVDLGELAAMHTSLAHLSLSPHHLTMRPSLSNPPSLGAMPLSTGQAATSTRDLTPRRLPQPPFLPDSPAEWEGNAMGVQDDPGTYSYLTRPLPQYTLEHVFLGHGPSSELQHPGNKREDIPFCHAFTTAAAPPSSGGTLNLALSPEQ